MTDTEPTTEPLSGDELVDAVQNKRDSVNPNFSSFDQGRAEELDWVLSLIAPPEPEAEETDDTTADEPPVDDPFDTSS